MEPFYYRINRNGNELLRVFQTGVDSESDKPVKWKLLRVNIISNKIVINEEFSSNRLGYNSDDLIMEDIYCCI